MRDDWKQAVRADDRGVSFLDTRRQDAGIRNPKVIGQVVRDIGVGDLARRRPPIPWSQIAGAGNILAHEYLGVDPQLVWRIVERDLPPLKAAVDAMPDDRENQPPD